MSEAELLAAELPSQNCVFVVSPRGADVLMAHCIFAQHSLCRALGEILVCDTGQSAQGSEFSSEMLMH